MVEKLVRDKIPDILREKGLNPEVRTVRSSELDNFLRAKIVEEAQELLESGDSEEIVDILEAVDALLELRKADRAMLDLQRETKKLYRGGFKQGYVLTQESDLDTI
ncbi:MAG: nucleoside triphosphate pyrophosphohydrolase [Candidatus Odinarchaeota archaeon]